ARSPVATVIAGAMSADQVRANAKSADWRLAAEELKELESALEAAR
ncbi:MAG: aldo/keto reductase, partial [Chloroflexi bacterium]|nr:aldo/keto reductase [Chloroflexota bacterium]